MIRVYLTHGVVRNFDRSRLVHRNLLDRDVFVAHLRSRNQPYVPLERALRGEGDALTVDDATHSGAEAARLARENGHAVTFFINPWHVAEARPYAPALLNAFFDTASSIRFRGMEWPGTAEGKRAAREELKKAIRAAKTGEEQERVIEESARESGVAIQLPPHLETLSTGDVRELQEIGVDIRNHGWMHLHHDVLTPEEKERNISAGEEWLRHEYDVESDDFAVPWGIERDRLRDHGVWYLFDLSAPPGFFGEGLVNREDLLLS
ncbi:MAG TPA: polysaccharide deacetylase family protein [Candidatus Paceibacterota bacterium]|nr:polysaccharide deacetylase family protein [Candidatus Paceibacterota bacterium]